MDSEALLPHLEWEDYYKEFKLKHGTPVPYGNRWLFPDGWTYAIANWGGPEWPPPEDPIELRKLKEAWVTTRKRMLVEQIRSLRRTIKNLQELQDLKDATLQQRVWQVQTDELGNDYMVDSGKCKPLTTAPMLLRVDLLAEELRSLSKEGN